MVATSARGEKPLWEERSAATAARISSAMRPGRIVAAGRGVFSGCRRFRSERQADAEQAVRVVPCPRARRHYHKRGDLLAGVARHAGDRLWRHWQVQGHPHDECVDVA